MAALAAMVGTCAAGVAWVEILYRLALFVMDYGCQRGVNHIGAGDFMLAYLFHGFFILALAFAAWIFSKEPGRWRSLACWAGAAHLIAALALATMHSTGILVDYGEFIRNRASAPNNFAQATPVSAILFVLSQVPGLPDDNRSES
jgi:hypothetical protein